MHAAPEPLPASDPAVVVTLTWHEVAHAANAGCQRQIQALARGRRHRYGFNGSGWDAHIEGAAAELAVAKATGTYWESVAADPHALPGDVGEWQIRATTRPEGCLIVHPSDPPDARFVLVVGRIPTFRIAGSIIGRDAQRAEWWRTDTGRPAFFVPQRALAHPPRRAP